MTEQELKYFEKQIKDYPDRTTLKMLVRLDQKDKPPTFELKEIEITDSLDEYENIGRNLAVPIFKKRLSVKKTKLKNFYDTFDD